MLHPKKHQNKDDSQYLNSALETYTSLLADSELSDSLMDEIESDFKNKINNRDFQEKYLIASELDQYSPLHTLEYDLDEDGISRLNQGVVVVAQDQDRTLILDGNHRRNTLLKHCPEQVVLIYLFQIKLPF